MVGVKQRVVEQNDEVEGDRRREEELLGSRDVRRRRRGRRCRRHRREVVEPRERRRVDANVDYLGVVVVQQCFQVVQGAEAEEGAVRARLQLDHDRHLSLELKGANRHQNKSRNKYQSTISLRSSNFSNEF